MDLFSPAATAANTCHRSRSTAIDSTGAGDAFIGSFAVFLGEGVPEEEAVRRANLYAGLSTTGVGTQKSFYDRARFDSECVRRRI